jgi:hypothetical protein
MFRLLVLSTAAGALGLLATNRATADHPHLYQAVYELRLAHEELVKAGHNFGGHKDKAILAIDASYRQIEKCLEAAGDAYSTKFAPPGGIYKGYKNHAHLRHSLVELREAHAYLKGASGNFGGHKKQALVDIDAAIVQVEKCIENIK